MIISLAGVGYAGAGAYFDLLCEYDDIGHNPNLFEFGLLYEADGLIDLVNKLKSNNSKITSYVPIRRFLELARFYNDYPWFKEYTSDFVLKESVSFIETLCGIKTTGRQLFDIAHPNKDDIIKTKLNGYILSKINRVFRTHFNISLENRLMYLYLDDKDIDESARRYFGDVLKHFKKEGAEKTLIKHLCPPDIPNICFPYLPDNTRHITVNRDPRDLYILGRLNNTSDFPCRNVEEFILYYSSIMKRQVPHDKVLYVYFEDLCYKYDETVRKVEDFICEKGVHHKLTHFFPEVSINNTRLILKHPEYSEDVAIIEDCLSQYLYSY